MTGAETEPVATRGSAQSPLDRPPTGTMLRAIPWLGASAAHGAIAALVLQMPPAPSVARRGPDVVATSMFEVDLEPEPAPQPEEPPPDLEPEPPKRVRPKAAAPPPPDLPEPEPEPATEPEPAPEAARAAKVLTQDTRQTPQTESAVPSGNAPVPPGGHTAALGTANLAVRNKHARALGVQGGTGSGVLDRSRPPRLAGGAQWDCPWPDEGDMVDQDEPTVTLRVQVSRNGSVQRVTVMDDPGFGFGREARRCALRKRWSPARDRAGRPVDNIALVRVRFSY